MKVKKSKKKRGGRPINNVLQENNILAINPPSYNNVLQENNRIDLLENRIEKIESYINKLVILVQRGRGLGSPIAQEHFKTINTSTAPSVFI